MSIHVYLQVGEKSKNLRELVWDNDGNISPKNFGDLPGIVLSTDKQQLVYANAVLLGRGAARSVWAENTEYRLALVVRHALPKVVLPPWWRRALNWVSRRRCSTCIRWDKTYAQDWYDKATHEFAEGVKRYGNRDMMRTLFVCQKLRQPDIKDMGLCAESKTMTRCSRTACGHWERARG